MKVTTKILLPMCSIILLGMVFIAYITYDMSSENMNKAQQDLNIMAVNNTISELSGIHEFNVLNAISLSQTGLLQPYLIGTPEEVAANTQGAIDRIVNMRKTYSYAMLGIIDTKGKTLRHTEQNLVGKDFSQDFMFTNAMQGHVTAGAPFLFNGRVVYAVSSPVYKTGTKEVIGVVFNVTYLDDTFSKRIPLGKKGSFMVADRNGTIFLSSDSSQVLRSQLNQTPWGKQIMQSRSGNLTFDLNGEEKFAYYDEQKDTGWVAIAALDVNESNASSLAIGQRIFGIAAMVTLIIVLVTGFCVIRMRNSLMVSVRFAHDIANGKLDAEIEKTSKDEMGMLAESLQNISHVLRAIIVEYTRLEDTIKHGDLRAQAQNQNFSGDFAKLIHGTNAIINNYLTVLDNIPSPVVVLDKTLKAKYVNKAGTDLAGTTYRDKSCRELFNREDDSSPQDGLQKAASTKLPQRGETIAHPQKGSLDIIYNAIPLLDDKTREVNALLQLITDVTAFKATQQTILHVAEQASQISAQVAQSSQELSTQLKYSEETAVVQASRASEASHIMDSMNNDVSVMASMAQEASEASERAKIEAENGADVVGKAVKSINALEAQSQKLKDGMEQLNENANAINEVIITIGDIADQTNLLALNAAIEAARAGESGRGFAVVADEVRKLAEKTMSSTTQVQQAISAIQSSVRTSVEQVNQSATEVQKTSQLVHETGTVFQSITHMVEQTSAQAKNIASSSMQQADHSHGVNTQLTEVNQLAAQTAASMQESLNAIDSLTSQSRALSELIITMQKQ